MANKKSLGEKVINDEIYPIIAAVMPKRKSQLKACIGRFIQRRHEDLYDYAPMKNIMFKQQDVDDFFNSIGVKEADIKEITKRIYWYKMDELAACKDPFSLSMLMVLKYYMMNPKDDDNKRTMFELSYMYLAFSGKFYAASYCKYFKYPPKKEVMDYVINYMLSRKYDIIKTGSVWGTMRNLAGTWANTYTDIIVHKPEDEQISMVIHQLHSRIYAFIGNIAKMYYKAYEEKLYINEESDNYEDGEKFRIANNNSTVAATITERTMNYMTSTSVSLARCQAASAKGVDPTEVKAIFENILNRNESVNDLRDVINIMIVDFMRTHPDVKAQDITNSTEFIAYSIAMKPNTKDKDLLRMKDIIIGWLNTSDRYKTVKTAATKNNYYKAILIYITLSINDANKGG